MLTGLLVTGDFFPLCIFSLLRGSTVLNSNYFKFIVHKQLKLLYLSEEPLPPFCHTSIQSTVLTQPYAIPATDRGREGTCDGKKGGSNNFIKSH